jgi:hypothetical protein
VSHRAVRPASVVPVLCAAVLLMATLSGAASLDAGEPMPVAALPAHDGLALVRADVGALEAPVYFKAANAEVSDLFGSAVALSRDGSTLAVGAELRTQGPKGWLAWWADGAAHRAGAVYVYVRTPRGWVQQAQLAAARPVQGSGFGFSLSLSDDGSTLAVGAPFESGIDAQAGEQGAVHVFGREGGRWSAPARLAAAPGADRFGVSVSLSGRGDVLAVGTPGQDGEAIRDLGAVHVFGRDTGAWTQRADLRASDPRADDGLGTSVALSIDGRTLAVGAQSPGRGAVHVFQQGTVGWNEQDVLVFGNGASTHERFGARLALSADGSTLAVGAAGAVGDGARHAGPGAVYLFARDADQWQQQARLAASNAEAGDAFGGQLALSADGHVLAVAALHEASAATGLDGSQSDNRAPQAGAVYLFARDAAAWRQQRYLKATNTGAGDVFGSALALSGDGGVLAVGAHLEDGGPAGTRTQDRFLQNSGAVYLYAAR